MLKKIAIAILILLALAAGAVYFLRYDIFQVSAENIIKQKLPSYIDVDRIIFDLKGSVMEIKGLGIKNPAGYKNKYLAHISSIKCTYRMRGSNILSGLEITAVKADGARINIERLPDGSLNVNQMDKVMASADPSGQAERSEAQEAGRADTDKKSGFDLSKFIKMTDTINITDSGIVLIDNYVNPSPYMLSLLDVTADLFIGLNADYTAVTSFGSEGAGSIEGDTRQILKWKVSLDPTARDLTMSSRINISNTDITIFQPYYDEYSPIVVRSGLFSGTLVFDFDHGNIGSMNTLKLMGLKFRQKGADSGNQFWDMTVSDIIKYLESVPGEITFDFSIKGSVKSPRFYPGPIVKQAIKNMAVDKISSLFNEVGGGGGGGGQSDADKVMNVLKGFLNK